MFLFEAVLYMFVCLTQCCAFLFEAMLYMFVWRNIVKCLFVWRNVVKCLFGAMLLNMFV